MDRRIRHKALGLSTAAVTLLWGCGRADPAMINGSKPAWIQLPQSFDDLSIHPFSAASVSPSLNRLALGQVTFHDGVAGVVQERLQNAYMRVNVVPHATGSTTGSTRMDVGFALGEIPLYGPQVAATMTSDRSTLMLGQLPRLSPSAVASASHVWPEVEEAQNQARGALLAPGALGAVDFSPAKQYYVATSSDSVKPVWRMIATVGGMPYQVLADDKMVYESSPFYYQDTTGSAQIDAANINDKAMVTYKLTGLVGDGTLHNQYLQTYLPSGYTQAVESTEVFNFPVADQRFDEVMAFAHTDSHFNWLLGLGGQTYGDLPIHILLHQLPGGTTNNALFMPGDADSGQPFQIILGDGDGQVLQNLSTDSDVPSHESGHYIIYNYLKQTSGESLAVHEGMADLLVFLQKNNPCLGPSICPAGSTACIQPGQCLRTADNTYAYNDANWQEWTQELGGQCCGHKHGQVLSGVAWDLVKNGTLGAPDMANMTLKAISYFQQSSGIRDYLLALLTADKELFQCKYDSQLRTAMAARNLTSLISDVAAGCASLPALNGTSQLGALISATPTPSAAAASSSASASGDTRKGIFSCGAVAGHQTAGERSALWLLVAMPLVLVGASSLRRRVHGIVPKAPSRLQ